jgi:hypothetical protein
MEQLNETVQLDREIEHARDDLRDTLEQVHHKVEEVEASLRPMEILRRNSVTLTLLAGVIGLLAGSDRQSRLLRWVAIGGLLGASLAADKARDNGKRRRRD